MTDQVTNQATDQHPLSWSDDTKLPALYAALAEAQGAFTSVERAKRVVIQGKDGKPGYSFFYAELAVVIAATRPALSANGLAVHQPLHHDGESLWLLTIITHKDGGALTYRMKVPGAEDIKAFGGQITYLRRYTYAPAVGVASEDDADEDDNGAGDSGQTRQWAPKPPLAPVELPFYTASDFAANLPLWRAAIKGNKATVAGIIAKVQTKYRFTAAQKAELNGDAPPGTDQ